MNPARREPDVSTYSGRLAKRVRQLRDKAGLTAEQVVQRMARFGYQIPVQTYYSWEGGHRKIHLDAIPALAKALKLKSLIDIFPRR